MGRDAKIGLLVGLSFILLFAVILAKRNADIEPADGAGNANDMAMAEPAGRTVPVPDPGTNLNPQQPLASDAGDGSMLPQVPNPGLFSGTPGDGTDLLGDDLSTILGEGERIVVEGAHRTPSLTPDPAPGLIDSGPGHSGLVDAGGPIEQPGPTSSTGGSEPENWTLAFDPGRSTEPAPATPRTTAPPAVRIERTTPTSPLPATNRIPLQPTSYKVVAGDTFSTISTKVYSTCRHWRRLLEANKTLVGGDARGLRPGMTLVVPVIAAPARTAAPGNSATRVARHTPRSPLIREPVATAVPRTYTVKAGDKLQLIAARELGDKSKWRRIYNLNKDRISDPNVIVVGTVLRLPDPIAPVRTAGASGTIR